MAPNSTPRRPTLVGVLLDELESIGRRGAGVDLCAQTLALPELDAAGRRWDTELDARGPWLRPLQT